MLEIIDQWLGGDIEFAKYKEIDSVDTQNRLHIFMTNFQKYF